MATNERYVSTNADLKVSRSRMPLNRRTLFSLFHGYLHPVGSPIEILPGDTIKAKISQFTRMSTPIVPFVDDVRQETDFWFVPKRILWNKTKQFYGEAPSFGIAAKVIEPLRAWAVSKTQLNTNILKSESLAGAFGLFLDDDSTGQAINPTVNLLTIRGLFAIYNEYYRDENYQDQYTWDKDAAGVQGTIGYLGGTPVTPLSLVPQVNKDRDVITSILPWAQKGDPVSIGLTGNVPVIVDDSIHSLEGTLKFGITSGSSYAISAGYLGTASADGGKVRYSHDSSFPSTSDDHEVTYSNMVAKLSSATAVKINDLLYAIAYQDFLARSAHFGTRYKEYIYAMFGTRIPDLSDDVPEYLGRMKFNINVQQVVQTTGHTQDASTELGVLGAYSNSGNSGDVFTKSFTEPGYLYVLTYCKHQRTYSSGMDRVFVKSELLDYYQPPFANIPDVPFGSLNVWVDKNGETSLGFQEPWFDYRALQDRTYGLMNPMLDTFGEIWTLAEKWSAKPTIAGEFMKEDRAAIARALATGSDGPDYICDVRLELDATRVMPLYSSGKLERF